jgi:hypothetical protein
MAEDALSRLSAELQAGRRAALTDYLAALSRCRAALKSEIRIDLAAKRELRVLLADAEVPDAVEAGEDQIPEPPPEPVTPGGETAPHREVGRKKRRLARQTPS